MDQRTAFPGRSTLASGIATALSLTVVTGLSAVVGVVIARSFGRSPETDGFFAAYALFLVLVLAGSAMRVAVLPPLARARAAGRFPVEFASLAAAIALVAAPVLTVSLLADDWLGARLTGGLPPSAADTAAETLRFVVPAAIAQVYAALVASGLAAYDSYGTAAAGYALGSVVGLATILLLVDEHGLAACAWGMAANGVVVLAVTAPVLLRRVGVLRPRVEGVAARLAELARAVALPLVLQGLFVVCVRFASDLGAGAITDFTYAYLVAAALVAVTASSLGLVSSVPLTRGTVDDARVAKHVAAAAWVAFAAVAGATGMFVVVGGDLVELALGPAYGGETGREVGRLVGMLGAWMAASVGVTLTFPLLFVVGKERRLPYVAAAALGLHLAVAWFAVGTWGLPGAAAALSATTALILFALLALVSIRVVRSSVRALGVAVATTAGAALVAFALAEAAFEAPAAAASGGIVYVACLLAVRRLGLAEAWSYLRSLK